MSAGFYILTGTVLLIAVLAWYVVSEVLDAEEYAASRGRSTNQHADVSVSQPVVIDTAGQVVVPEGANIWVATRQCYVLYRSLFGKYLRDEKTQQEVYLYDVVGTPITPEQQERINAHYGE